MLESILETHLLDIVSLKSSVARSSFSKEKIDQLASNLLKAGGNIRPILVKRVDLEEFEVLQGHLEHYAAVRAREIDDDFELIRGIILSKKNEELILQQYEQIYGDGRSPVVSSSNTTTPQMGGLADLEKNLVAHLQDTLKFEVDRLKSTITKDLKEQFNGVRIVIPNDQDHLDTFNQAETHILKEKLTGAGFGNAKAIKMATAIVAERKNGKFTSFAKIIERVHLENGNKAVTEKSMVKILDTWNSFIDTKHFK